MAAAPITGIKPAVPHEPLHVTLLELVEAVGDVTDNDLEVVATVIHMLENGRVRLSGSFRETPITSFC